MNRIVVVNIDHTDQEGRGVGRTHAGQEVHAPDAVPGETVHLEIEHESPHQARAWGRVIAHEGPPSEDRVTPCCPEHGRCGGCSFGHISYSLQLREKRRRIEAALAIAGLGGLPVLYVHPSPSERQYRNTAKFVVVGTLSGIIHGSYTPRSHQVVGMNECLVLEDPITRIAQTTMRLLALTYLAVLNKVREPHHPQECEYQHELDELRYLIVRSNWEKHALVTLVTRTDAPRKELLAVSGELMRIEPLVTGVVHNVNPTTGNAIYGSCDSLLAGQDALTDKIGHLLLELSSRAFFQVNRAQAAYLYSEVARLGCAGPGQVAVDLYSGVGGIALFLAERGSRVLGVESNASAVGCAERSAQINHLDHLAQFSVADAGEGLSLAQRILGHPDLVVVNPPRKGLHHEATEAVLDANPKKVIYVSCSPETLARDLANFLRAGYSADPLLPVDLMPGTPEVETIAVLRRE